VTRFALIVTDAGPLITLAVAQALDTLLLAKLPVIVPDMVRFEVVRDSSKPGAQEVADWIRRHEGDGVRVASTEVFEEYQVLLAANPATRTKDRGEQAAAEVLGRELTDPQRGAILLFEDSGVRKQNFLIRLPDEVLVLSTSEFLFGLESARLLTSAADVLARATTLRGNQVLERHVHGTGAAASSLWPDRLKQPRRRPGKSA
jgi:hypothetical protein